MAPPQSLQNVLVWPIKAKGAIQRHNPLGDPKIEKKYHEALEDGRWLERNIGDANHWLLQKKQYVLDKVKTYTDMNSLAVDAQLKRRPRIFKLGADSIRLLQTVNQFQRDIIGLVQAITQNIGLLSSMEQNVLQMVQANLNAIAILLNEICNWGIPDLPAIPNLFSDTIWWWNGFNFFPLAAFQPHLGFDKNFAFNQCQIHIPNINIFRNYPSSVQTYSGLSYGTTAFVPPLGGLIPNTGINLSDPNFVQQMQVTNTDPVYGPTFNPNSSMLGSVPDASTIISNYQMPSQTYRDNIVSIVPDLRQNVVEPGDSDYDNPDVGQGSVRATNLRKDLQHYVTLDAVVNSNYEPYLTSAWLFYVNNARNGRAGSWLNQYQAVYDEYVTPSITSFASNNVPWNNVLGGPGVVNTPKDIPFVDVLADLSDTQRNNVLWQLSYIEASLLGYTRSKTWDAYQDANYLSTTTGSDLDYKPTTLDLTNTAVVVLGQGTASYPVSCTYPISIAQTLSQVIAQAADDIAADLTYQSPLLSNRFVYNQFAQATAVDRFTQFWRDFNTNMKAFLAQDPYVIQFAATYVGILNGALNPLGDQTAYSALKVDAATRDRNWSPGLPLLTIPKAPLVGFIDTATITAIEVANNVVTVTCNNGFSAGASILLSGLTAATFLNSQTVTVASATADYFTANFTHANYTKASDTGTAKQVAASNGWSGVQFDANAFLSRPDIQAQPIGVQIAMLRTNQSYASLLDYKTQAVNAIENQIANAKAILAQASQFGFQVETTTDLTVPAATNYQIVYDLVDYDITGNVDIDPLTHLPTGQFTIQQDGNYAVFGTLNWETPAESGEAFNVTVFKNNVAILTQSSDAGFTTPVALQFSTTDNFSVGDVVKVVASHGYPTDQILGAGTFFSMIQAGAQDNTQVPSDVTSSGKTFIADTTMTAMTAVAIQSDGHLDKVDPTLLEGHLNAVITHINVTGNILTVTCNNSFTATGTIYNFSGLTGATFLNGQSVTIMTASPTQFTAAFVHADYDGAETSPDAIANGGTILIPNVDGITLASVVSGNGVECGTNYGGVYQVFGMTFTVGGLFYIAADGTMTQDYDSIINGPNPVAWVICVGRALSADTFIYEPHIPTRVVSIM